MTDQALAKVDAAKRALESVKDLTDAMKVRDLAVAASAFARARGSHEAFILAQDVKLRAERKAGQFLKEGGVRDPKQGRPRKVHPTYKRRQKKSRKLHDFLPTLTEQGIKADESKRWQLLARIPDEKWEAYLVDARKRTQMALLELAKEEETEAARLAMAKRGKDVTIPPTVRLIHGDFRDVEIAGDSIDLIITDPPYSEEYLALWSDLGAFAGRVLRPGSMLVAYAPQEFLPRILNDLMVHLSYYWIGGVIHGGGRARIWKKGITVRWKPILFFVKGQGAKEHGPFDDIVTGHGVSLEKASHDWAQGEEEASYLIGQLTAEAGTVLDPMCGPGTFVRAAWRLGRRAIGIELDESSYGIARALFEEGAEAIGAHTHSE